MKHEWRSTQWTSGEVEVAEDKPESMLVLLLQALAILMGLVIATVISFIFGVMVIGKIVNLLF